MFHWSRAAIYRASASELVTPVEEGLNVEADFPIQGRKRDLLQLQWSCQ